MEPGLPARPPLGAPGGVRRGREREARRPAEAGEGDGVLPPHNATLVIAKLDRLSRDAHFLLGLQKAGVRFLAADMPEANEMVVGIMAVVAQAERKMISARTKSALAAAKARGRRLGNPGNLRNEDVGRIRGRARRTAMAQQRTKDLAPIIADIQAAGAFSFRQIAAGLNAR